ncbi:adenosylcobinamide-phosphate synthase CbiB [Anoxynatronum buryatiense]|uniref:Cobalamin biosynthesis protein CobD n=1 Tax=Anoxynatronum buryatiense TaxID=489973 RepID=A0AA45WTG0_9CLOT|nr:adenosylcobinamide-phosphate synthase CbiB [Anoxynatronum buryatiense]SMP39027.1 adenosylcobinamide-phosphate synthase [Anoxynatronum buryatiense]
MIILTAYILDLLLADPPHWPHPVRWMGALIGWFDHRLRCTEQSGQWQMFRGGIMVAFVVMAAGGAAALILKVASLLHIWLGTVLAGWLAYTSLSAKGLKLAALDVLIPLEQNNLPEARRALSMIVGRETEHLTEKEVVRATVETVAENFSDGVVAPLFYLALGGVPMAIMYKAVNTMDSMVGYRNERYLYFGRPAARLDDILNWVPARLSVVLLVVGAMLTGNSALQAWKIARRDGRNHKSPNAGWPEAAVAGALQVQLGGTNIYFGRPVEKPTIGDEQRELTHEAIRKAVVLLDAATLVAVIAGTLCLLIIPW